MKEDAAVNKRLLGIYFPLIAATLLLTWWIGTRYVENRTQHTLQTFQERERLSATYEQLYKRWSQKAQKQKRQRFKKWMQIRQVPFHDQRTKGKIVYKLTLHHDTADEAIRRIFDLPLAFTKMRIQKRGEDELTLRLEMPE